MRCNDIDWVNISKDVIFRHWNIILASGVLFLFISVFYLIVTPPRYYIHTVLTSTDNENSSSSSLASVSSALGFNLQSGNSPYFSEYLETLTSEDVAVQMEKAGWLQRLFPKSWDGNCKCWKKRNFSPIFFVKKWINTIFGRKVIDHPTSENIHKILSEKIKIIPINNGGLKTNMIELEFYYNDRNVGLQFLNSAIATAETIVRVRANQRANRYIQFLSSQLANTTNADQRTAIYQMLGTQETIVLNTAAKQSFSYRSVISTTASFSPVSPSIIGTLIIGLILGIISGYILSFVIVVNKR
jgi:capsular polysaccharide biosynthesis protein